MGDFKPTVIIGLGGVGKSILLRVRRMIVENYKRLDNLPSIAFLHADTAAGEAPDAGVNTPVEVLGQRLSFSDTEQVNLSANISSEIHQGVDNIKNNRAIKEWFNPDLPIDITFSQGAGGIRPYGRLAFQYAADTFRQKLNEAIRRVVDQTNIQTTAKNLGMQKTGENSIDIFIACSLMGGTGSGCFLEAAYNTLSIAKTIVPSYIIGTLILGGNVTREQRANCYSALKELDYHSTAFLKGIKGHFNVSYPIANSSIISEDAPPFTLCYLISPLGEGYILNRDQLEEAVALNIYLDFGSTIASEKRARRVDFVSKDYFKQLDSELQRSKQFLSFGISTLEFPAPRIQDMMAHELASFVTNGWLFDEKKASPVLDQHIKDIRDEVEEKKLLNELLTIDNKSIQLRINATLSEQETKIDQLITVSKIDADLVITTVNDHINRDIDSVKYSMDPKDCGQHAREISKTAYDKQQTLAQTIIKTVNTLIENEYRGPKEAKSYLAEINKLLRMSVNTFKSKHESFDKSAAKAQEPLYAHVPKFRTSIGQDKFAMQHFNKKIHLELLAGYLNMSLKREGYRAAFDMIETDRSEDGVVVPSLLSLVEALENDVDYYIQTLRSLSERLNNQRRELESTIIGTPIAEGISLTSARLKEIGKSVIPNPVSHIKLLLNYIKDALSEKDKDGNLIKQPSMLELVTRRKEDVESLLVQECSEICKGVRRISVAGELKDMSDLKTILKDKIRHSMPMIQASGFQDGENINLSALATDDPGNDKDLRDVCKEVFQIKQYSDFSNRHLTHLSDPYRIIFASEKGIFPLRRITMLNDYRKDYRVVKPKHTDVRINYPDIFSETEEARIKERIQHAVFLGKFFEFLSEKDDVETGYKFIFLSYFDENSRSMIHSKLYGSWNELEEKLPLEQIEKEIDKKRIGSTTLDILEGLIETKMKALKTKKEKEEMWVSLQCLLEALACELEGGDMNPEYQRQLGIIKKFRETYRLTPPDGYSPSNEVVAGIKNVAEIKVSADTTVSEPSPSSPLEDQNRSAFHASLKLEDQYRKALRASFNKGGKDKEKLTNWGIKFCKLPKERASMIYDETMTEPQNNPIEHRLQEYRESFELATIGGEITPETRLRLQEMQQELQLTDTQIRLIEEPIVIPIYRREFEEALIGGIISSPARDYLKDFQKLLNLDNKQIQQIESSYQFNEEKEV